MRKNVLTKVFDGSHGVAYKYGENYSESFKVKAFEMTKEFINHFY